MPGNPIVEGGRVTHGAAGTLPIPLVLTGQAGPRGARFRMWAVASVAANNFVSVTAGIRQLSQDQMVGVPAVAGRINATEDLIASGFLGPSERVVATSRAAAAATLDWKVELEQ